MLASALASTLDNKIHVFGLFVFLPAILLCTFTLKFWKK